MSSFLTALLSLFMGLASLFGGGASGLASPPSMPSFSPLSPGSGTAASGPPAVPLGASVAGLPSPASPAPAPAHGPGPFGAASVSPPLDGAPDADALPAPSEATQAGACPGDVALVGDSITVAAGYRQALQAGCPGSRFTTYAEVGRPTPVMLSGFGEVTAGGHDAVVILGGVNNIADPGGVTSDLQQMYAQARQAGMKVVGVTVLPYKGYPSWSAARGQNVRQVDGWIRQQAGSAADAVADGFAAMEDPDNPDALRAGESRDHLHPNHAGYQRLGPVITQALASAR